MKTMSTDNLVDALEACRTDLEVKCFTGEGDLLDAIDMLRLRLKTINNTVDAALAQPAAEPKKEKGGWRDALRAAPGFLGDELPEDVIRRSRGG